METMPMQGSSARQELGRVREDNATLLHELCEAQCRLEQVATEKATLQEAAELSQRNAAQQLERLAAQNERLLAEKCAPCLPIPARLWQLSQSV